jgi:hypothetical protein
MLILKWVVGEQSMNIRAGIILPMTISVTGSREYKAGFLLTVNNRMSGKTICFCGT